LRLSPQERVVKDVLVLQQMCDDAYQKLGADQQQRVRYVCYENVFVNAKKEFQEIAEFLGVAWPEGIEAVITRERIPRPQAVSLDSRRKKLGEIEKQCGVDVYEELLEASRIYEEQWGLQPLKG
jgi:hypothetical protein